VPREAALSGSGCEKRRNTVEKLWEVDPTPVKNLGNDLCFEIWEKGRNGCYIAEVRGEANARLIAAAPDMYLALTRIRDRVASLRDLHPEWADIMDAAVHAEDFSAIAKAEGK
jgi:hypothetical protein